MIIINLSFNPFDSNPFKLYFPVIFPGWIPQEDDKFELNALQMQYLDFAKRFRDQTGYPAAIYLGKLTGNFKIMSDRYMLLNLSFFTSDFRLGCPPEGLDISLRVCFRLQLG